MDGYSLDEAAEQDRESPAVGAADAPPQRFH